MTLQQFGELTQETIPHALFHVSPHDIDDETGAQLDEVLLLRIIANDPTCLTYKPLQWFLDTYLVSKEDWDKSMLDNNDQK